MDHVDESVDAFMQFSHDAKTKHVNALKWKAELCGVDPNQAEIYDKFRALLLRVNSPQALSTDEQSLSD